MEQKNKQEFKKVSFKVPGGRDQIINWMTNEYKDQWEESDNGPYMSYFEESKHLPERVHFVGYPTLTYTEQNGKIKLSDENGSIVFDSDQLGDIVSSSDY